MSYTPMPDSWTDAGKPTKEEIFKNLVENQESFNADIEALKQTSRIDIFDMSITGFPNEYDNEISSFMPVFRSPVGGSIVNVLITLLAASASGTLAIQLYKSTDDGVNWTPILNTPTAVTGTSTGSINGSVSFVSPTLQAYDENDLFKVMITGLQVNQGAFHISVYGELGA